MSTTNKFGRERLLNPSHARLNGQERVNAEIFTAMEILGRKLERVETERDQLARRLALIESSTEIDEKTGRLYLPMLVNANLPAMQGGNNASSKWMVAASLMSSAIALLSLGIVLFHDPLSALTKEQLAALDSLKGAQFAMISPETRGWKHLGADDEIGEESLPTVASVAPSVADIEPAASDESAPLQTQTYYSPYPHAEIEQPEQVTEAPQPDEIPVMAEVAPQVEEKELPEETKPVALTKAQDVFIPGEDKPAEKPAEKAIEKIVEKKEPKKAPPVAEKAPEPPVALSRAETVTPPPLAEKKVEPVPIVPPKPPEVIADAAPPPPAVSQADMPSDPALPAKLAQLEKRAYEGIPEAQHDLATLYASGKLVAQNYKRAIYWFGKSADGGVANAHYNLGVIYQQGLGIQPDIPKAITWYEKAAELGHPEAMYNLGIAYIEGIGVKVSIERGISYFKRAANAGVSQAAYNLGVLYESNFVGAIDTKKAIEWYQIAANEGHGEANSAIARLNGAASGDQALTLAETVEPASGEEYGEGDSSPVSEGRQAPPPRFTNQILSKVQAELVKLGLWSGKPDGVMSPQLSDAIRAYQKKIGVTEDGQPSQILLDKMLQSSVRK